MTLPPRLAQLLMVGIQGTEITEDTRYLLQDLQVGGIILFRRNIVSPEQVFRLIQDLRSMAPHPLLIGIDQEGGRVQRVRAPLTVFPPMLHLGETADLQLIEEVAYQMAVELLSMDIDLQFAPVVDVYSNPANTVIGDRAFGTKPALVAAAITAFIRGQNRAGILSCAKHFPGHGDTVEDSHYTLPVLPHDLERLRQVEWPPFRAACAAGVSSIMTAHVKLPAIDSEYPATLSPSCLGYLREEIGWSGLLLSDDLEMGAIAHDFPIEQAAVQAVYAGCDWLLVAHTREKIEQSLAALEQAYAAGILSSERIHQAHERIEYLQQKRLQWRKNSPSIRMYTRPPLPSGKCKTWLEEIGQAGVNGVPILCDPTESSRMEK